MTPPRESPALGMTPATGAELNLTVGTTPNAPAPCVPLVDNEYHTGMPVHAAEHLASAMLKLAVLLLPTPEPDN